MKKYIAILCMVILMMAGCAQNEVPATSQPANSQGNQSTEPTTRTFVDSAGREVQVPTTITKVAPTGVPSQMVLFTACPDNMIGLARDFSEENKRYLQEKYQNMEVFGQFYGKNANLNMEALLKAAPDVIIDIGEPKASIKEDMDALQQQLQIPVVFIEASMSDYDKTYQMLGELLSSSAEIKPLQEYAARTITATQELAKAVTKEDKKSVYMALGDNGLSTNAKGSYHAQVLECVGAENVAEIQGGSTGGGTEISLEQLLLWNPDVIITDKETTYHTIISDPSWAVCRAVKEGQVYKIPTAPFNFISDPPSVNRLIGINWLGNLLYPDIYSFDQQTFTEFSRDFYHTVLSAEQVDDILKYSLVA